MFLRPNGRPVRGSIVKPARIPAPILGMNTERMVHDLRPDEAVLIVDGTCRHYGVEPRGGTEAIDGHTGTIANINPRGVPHIFATNLDTAILIDTLDGLAYASNGTQVFADAHESPYVSTQLSVADTSFIMFCREGGQPRLFNSSSAYTLTNTSTPYAITGVPTDELSFCFLFKRRIWFTRLFSTSLYYLAPDSIAGALTEFPLGPQLKKGGRPFALAEWSSDSGTGLDSYFIILTTQGELIVYQGTDPDFAESWELVGNYAVGEPFRTPFCMTKSGGDLLILTKKGVFSFARLLSGKPADASNSLTQKIQTLFNVLSAKSIELSEVPGIPTDTLTTVAGDYLITVAGDYLVWQYGDGLPPRGMQKMHFSEAESLLLIHFYFPTLTVPYVTLAYSMETKGWSIWQNLSVSGFTDFRGQLCGPTDSRFLNVYSREGLVVTSPTGINLPSMVVVTAPQRLGTAAFKEINLIKPLFQTGKPFKPTTPSPQSNISIALLADFKGPIATTIQASANVNYTIGGLLPDYFNLLAQTSNLFNEGILVRNQFSEAWIGISAVAGQHFTLVLQDRSVVQNPTVYMNSVFQGCEVLVGPGGTI